MAQIEQSDKGGKKKKGAQKKFSVHVDFTPMVDMNMLLLTFFMLCTTMLKSQTLQVTLPSNIKSEQNQQKVSEKNSLTMILDTNEEGKHEVYFYTGAIKFTETGEIDLTQPQPAVSKEDFIGNNSEGKYQGIRKVLYERNKTLMDEYLELKNRWKTGGFGEGEEARAAFEDAAKALRSREDIDQLNVLLKPMSNTSYECLISALDELQINQISRYRIQAPNAADSVLIQNAFPDKVIKL